MKLLRVVASHFKNCADDYTVDLVARAKRTSEDCVYELQEIAPDLYTYKTAAFVGKNASGKTSALELLDWAYSILGEFRLEGKHADYEDVRLEIHFYHEGFIYRYRTTLKADTNLGDKAIFVDQQLACKQYYKSYVKQIYDDNGYNAVPVTGALPEDTSIVFSVLQKRNTYALYYDSEGKGTETYALLFRLLKYYRISTSMLYCVLRLFDANVQELEMRDDHNYVLRFAGQERIMSDKELIYMLSSGTTKGILLYVMAIAALQNGIDLLIDEIENHFHKTLVENLLSLFKDPLVNRQHASLIFTTHYCELLDHFNRQDNIWVAQTGDKVVLKNLFEHYSARSELLKSRRFYNNAFDTAVDYDALMALKAGLM